MPLNEALEHTLDRFKSATEEISNRRDAVSREIDSQIAKASEELEKQKAALHSQLDHRAVGRDLEVGQPKTYPTCAAWSRGIAA